MLLWLTVTDTLGFLGMAGTVIAIASAIVAVVAFAVGSEENRKVATGIWPGGVLLALCNGITGNWILLAIALLSLPAAVASMALMNALRGGMHRRHTRTPAS
jgi:formate hydrogenlyase subunit 3/multisubunit Na+/H+ antiporter MnhD subunit